MRFEHSPRIRTTPEDYPLAKRPKVKRIISALGIVPPAVVGLLPTPTESVFWPLAGLALIILAFRARWIDYRGLIVSLGREHRRSQPVLTGSSKDIERDQA